MKQTLIPVDEQIFELINSSQNLAGIEFDSSNIAVINKGTQNPYRELLTDIDNDIILEFLRCPETKVFLSQGSTPDEPSRMIAHNYISNETIEIKNISDHFIAMNRVLFLALEKRKELKSNPEAKIISHELILSINKQLLRRRYDLEEVGIGKYRGVDGWGRPCNPVIATIENGMLVPIADWQPERGGLVKVENENGEVESVPRVKVLLDELLDWVNSEDFRQTEPLLRTAMFYTRFMHIHPFMDGNSRTDRMLLNYLLIISGKKPSNVANASYEDFLDALTQAIVYKNYDPFVSLIKKHQVNHSRELYTSIMDTNKLMEHPNKLKAIQIQ